jgi:membrane protease YdiL (CAAX protease family)
VNPTPGPETEALARAVGLRLRWGAALALAATLALGFGTALSFWEVIALPVFLVIFPTLALAQTPLLHLVPIERTSAYVSSGLTILIMGAMALGLAAMGPGAEAVGIAAMPTASFLGWSAGLTVGAVLLSVVFRPLEARAWKRSDRGTLDDGMLDVLLPRTPEERRFFGGLSLAAGWGEEMAYRGYVPAALVMAGLDPWASMGLAALAFGFLHAYQGPVGVVRTALLGSLLGASVLLTGSLFPAMVAHALVDLILGLVLGPWLLDRESDRPSGPPTP